MSIELRWLREPNSGDGLLTGKPHPKQKDSLCGKYVLQFRECTLNRNLDGESGVKWSDWKNVPVVDV